MDLKFSHVDVLVNILKKPMDYHAQILKARISKTLAWERGGSHVMRDCADPARAFHSPSCWRESERA